MQIEVASKRFYFLKKVRAELLAKFGPGADQFFAEYKRELLAEVQGTVVEVGPGTGSNLRYFGSGVEWIGFEPNQFMHKHLSAEMSKAGIRGTVVNGYAECIAIKTGSADFVISTFVLCSVSDPAKSLREIRRVLKPEGQFVFIEHTAAQRGTWLRWLQKAVRPLWSLVGDGCCPDRDIVCLIRNAGFEMTSIKAFKLNVESLLTAEHIAGRAIKDDCK